MLAVTYNGTATPENSVPLWGAQEHRLVSRAILECARIPESQEKSKLVPDHFTASKLHLARDAPGQEFPECVPGPQICTILLGVVQTPRESLLSLSVCERIKSRVIFHDVRQLQEAKLSIHKQRVWVPCCAHLFADCLQLVLHCNSGLGGDNRLPAAEARGVC